ncbi:MAG: Fe-S cluster assembly ATPase SufC [Deltaproteobacteria bacterium]|jgi:Fe-S cluster assembly ATP-binding protein|nr:Fe-S cluster assembly ATPase SufC [Deltaproteobacteria bacterium]MBW2534899.1 Fe-S cluster assembly ATPase SufC [Deltaproteobacteria bacterium]
MSDSKQAVLSCRDVRVFVNDKPIVLGVTLDVLPGERHALMGPNGSGKSTFAQALMGHPAYRLEGEIYLRGERIDQLSVDERARRGMFLGFQYPVAVPGVSVASFLRAAVGARRGEKPAVRTFRKEMFEAFKLLSIPREFAGRYLNDGFSGGEKKRLEILQLLLLEPAFALLDEIDSGLDIDALKVVSAGIEKAIGPDQGLLMVTHYQRILDHVRPDRVHVFVAGRIARSGGPEQALELEEHGYEDLDLSAGDGSTTTVPSHAVGS